MKGMLVAGWIATCVQVAGGQICDSTDKAADGGIADNSEWNVCEAGSACWPDLLAANRSLEDMWEDVGDERRARRMESELARLEFNLQQPARIPKFTAEGYKKARVPEDVFVAIREFYNTHKDREVAEETPDEITYVNHWVVDPCLLPLTASLREKLMSAVQPFMEAWAGEALEPTSCYGIRSYRRGSILAIHVDQPETHVISGIINVEQDVDVDWPLYVKDHDKTIHNVIMKPGDLILYESATVVHGRPTPLVGENYANVFVHFKPVRDWDFRCQEFGDRLDAAAEL